MPSDLSRLRVRPCRRFHLHKRWALVLNPEKVDDRACLMELPFQCRDARLTQVQHLNQRVLLGLEAPLLRFGVAGTTQAASA